MNDELPEGWSSGKFEDLVVNYDGRRIPLKSADRDRRPGKYPYYGASGIIDDIDEFLFDGEFLLVAEDGANLLSRSTPIAFRASGQFWVNNHAHVLQPRDGIHIKWLEYYLNSIDLSFHITGTAQPKLTQGALNEIAVPVAPAGEQCRVVAKVERTVAKVTSCQERLAAISVTLKRFRQALLAAACTGRLTADWRAERGLKGNADEIPSDWQEVCVGAVITDLKYGTAQKCSNENRGTAVLRIPNVADGSIDHSDLKYAVLPQKERERLRLVIGDILIIRSNGSVSLVGRSALVRKQEEGFAYAGYLIRIRPQRTIVEPSFLNLVLGSYDVRSQIELEARSTSGVNNINSEEVRSLHFLLPPVDEQKEILRRVDALAVIGNKIEARYEKAKAHVDKLTQSILAKAFRGELVPTEAELAKTEGRSYETAAQLLERIEGQTTTPTDTRARKRAKRA